MKVHRFAPDDLPESIRLKLNQTSILTSDRFARLWQTVGGRPVCYVAEDNSEYAAALPAIEFGHLFWKRLQSMPDGTYSRLIVLNESVNRTAAGRLLLENIRSTFYLKAHLHDFHREFSGPERWEMKECQTHITELTDSDWQPPDSKLRSEIRKAQREGVQLRKYNHETDQTAFHGLRKSTEARHGGGRYPTKFYDALAQLAARDDRVWWYVVEAGGELAASHVYLRDGDMLLNWMVHFDKKFSHLKPNQFITCSVAEMAFKRGVTKLNLGSTPVDAPSLANYKEKWGGDIYRYPCYYYGRGGL